jgi:FkbM family methyltransferase
MKFKSNFYESVLTAIINKKKLTNIVQIGANDGRINDPIYNLVMAHHKMTNIALVEPQSEVLPFLVENYKEHPHASVWEFAIGAGSSLTLYRLKPMYYDRFIRRHLKESPSYRVPTGFSSSSKEHVLKHICGNLPNDININESIEAIEVPVIDLKQLLQKTSWQEKKVDILQIDTEGMDDIVISACNIEELRPIVINFEHQHLTASRYEKVCGILSQIGYQLYQHNHSDTLACRLPIKLKQ